jgi:hypothetical protein
MYQSIFEKHLANKHIGKNDGSCYEGAVKAQNQRLIATERAVAILKRQGRGYPTKTSDKTYLEHYDDVLAYGDLLAKYTLQEMQRGF